MSAVTAAARPLRFRRRTALMLVATSLFGVASFAWPLVVSASSGANGAHSGDAPWILVALLPLLLAILVGEMADGALDAKAIAMLGVLAACGSALRLASPGVAGFEPTFFLLIPAGRVLGRGFGFVLGAVTLFASALLTGGVGPWLPFQMFGAAWMGFGAGSLPRCRGRMEIALLVAYTALAALAYGAVLNFWFWPLELGGHTRISYLPSAGVLTNLHHFLTFDATTSLGFDIPRAVVNGVLVAVLGPAVLATLRRAARRAAFDAPVSFAPAPRVSGPSLALTRELQHPSSEVHPGPRRRRRRRPVSIANRDQAEKWNTGDDARHWLIHQSRYDRMLGPFTDMILDTAGLEPSERVLDVGCGCGATTLAAARVVANGDAVGIDLSVPMLVRARADADAAGLRNATFVEGDAQVHPFEQASFDAVLSRFGTMFFADPVAAFSNLRHATRPGGRLVFVCWQPFVANEWLVVLASALAEHVVLPDLGSADGPGMFALADPEVIHAVLGAAGWRDVKPSPAHIPILVGGGRSVDEAVDFLRTGSIGRTVLEGVDTDTECRALTSVHDALSPHADSAGVHLNAAVWLVDAKA